MSVICLGDSITRGFGVKNYECWVSILNSLDRYALINKGINGDTTASMLERLWRDVLTLNAEYCIILAGTNDFLMGRSTKYVFENISLLATDCIKNKYIPIIGSPIPTIPILAKKYWDDSIDYELVNNKLNKLNSMLKDLSVSKNILFIDLYKVFIKRDSLAEDLYTDGIHPNALGHKLIAENIQFLLDKISKFLR
ncbi:hypothetical protein IAI10_08805 [Clostridium sp. 19966]|uniref:GDSL-type esterase/lipase family protein n=1 Tax=Clostridium sp. 19966 TaxID=2768166 RepID=UPI0028DDFA75|nr:GDSL-type esterase/lipase family protein [Clostridium sp. 19966]MDT8716756.1 hypothetical protein [Clostridium sp. 19966]